MRIRVADYGRPIINYDALPAALADHVLLLTNREMFILLQLIYPYLTRAGVFVHPIEAVWYNTLTDAEQLTMDEEVETLTDKLSGGGFMDIDAFVAGVASKFISFIDNVSDTNLAAGSVNISSTAVPAGELWHVVSFHCREVSTSITTMYVQVIVGGVGSRVLHVAAPVSGTYYIYTGSLWLNPGDTIRCYVVGATAGDDLYLSLLGYKVATT